MTDARSKDSATPGFRRGVMRRVADGAITALARRGLAPGGAVALTVVGRRSGEPRTLPVTPLSADGRVHLVAPYGVVGWVKDLRAAGQATIERGGTPMRVRAIELEPAQAAPVLREYVRRVPLVRPYVAADPDDGPAAFEAIAAQHPVFAIERIG
ncbi:nitroreductase family deazaflavin-dependent oxidoreductase [Agrococcus sp. DT81.2]|uniref:nitroreductase family deazaflavin-dependent oxidoreductase n=1 Tax=Agrococcus sp. DT81.2 TaxID=3393414 RepID=UPI003CE44E36